MKSTVISPFTYSKACTHSNLLSMSEIEICLLFSLSLLFFLSIFRSASRWIKSKTKCKCFLFSISPSPPLIFPLKWTHGMGKFIFNKKKTSNETKIYGNMNFWTENEDDTHKHTPNRQVLSICGKKKRREENKIVMYTQSQRMHRMIYPHKFQENSKYEIVKKGREERHERNEIFFSLKDLNII